MLTCIVDGVRKRAHAVAFERRPWLSTAQALRRGQFERYLRVCKGRNVKRIDFIGLVSNTVYCSTVHKSLSRSAEIVGLDVGHWTMTGGF